MNATTLSVKTNALPSSRLAVNLEVSAETCQKSYEESLSSLSRSVKLPGFRKGKVPKAVILQQIGINRIKANALEKILDNAWQEAIQQESIEPLSQPELKDSFESLLENFNPSKPLKFTLETDVAPEPKLKTTKDLDVEVEKVIYDPQKVNDLIDQSRKQLATLIPVEKRSAQKNDIAVVSFKGKYEDGSEIEGGSADSMDIELEEGKMIPGFIEGIIGMKIGDTNELKCNFPDDYPQADAQGKKAIFSLTLKELKTRELPELDDKFAKQSGNKASMEELKKDLEQRLKEENKEKNKENEKESLIECLTEQLEVDIPNSMIDQEVRILVEDTARKFAQQGMDVKSMFTPEIVKSLMESSKGEAEKSLRRKMALKALAKQEGIEAEQELIEKKYIELQEELKEEKNIDLKKLKRIVEDDVLEEKLFMWLKENITIKEKVSEKSSTSKSVKAKSKKSEKTEKKS